MNPIKKLPNYDKITYKLFYWGIIVTFLIGGFYFLLGAFFPKDNCSFEKQYCIDALEIVRDSKLEKIDDVELDLILKKKFGFGLKETKKFAETTIKHSDDKVTEGLAYITLGDFESAIESFNEGIEANFNNDKAWFNKFVANIFLIIPVGSSMPSDEIQKSNHFHEALDSYYKAIEINPDDEYLEYLDFILFLSTNLNNKYDYLEKLIKLNPDLEKVWILRGELMVTLCNFSEAILSFNKVLELKPNDEETKIILEALSNITDEYYEYCCDLETNLCGYFDSKEDFLETKKILKQIKEFEDTSAKGLWSS